MKTAQKGQYNQTSRFIDASEKFAGSNSCTAKLSISSEWLDGGNAEYIKTKEVRTEMDSEKLFDILREDRIQSERRVELQMSALEERLTRQSEKSEERIFKAVDDIKTQISDIDKKLDSAKGWIIGIALTTILGIAAMVISVIVTK